jgi:TonB family protein
MIKPTFALAATIAWLFVTGCASSPSTPRQMVLSCAQLFGSAPEGTMVPRENMPRLRNPGDVQRRLMWINREATARQAVVQLLVQPDGSVSHGCVRQTSGNVTFDRAALEAAKEARFEPAQLEGRPVDAWVVLPLGVGT